MKRHKSEEELDEMERLINPIILDENDLKEKKREGISECIVDNWVVAGWYFQRGTISWTAWEFFSDELPKKSITTPIYVLANQFDDGGQQVFDPQDENDIAQLQKILKAEQR